MKALRRILVTLAVALALIALPVGWYWYRNYSAEQRALRAIDAAIHACREGNAAEYARRKVEARLAIDDVEGWKAIDLTFSFDNQLAMANCP